jgi:hypothetical protein
MGEVMEFLKILLGFEVLFLLPAPWCFLAWLIF